MKGLGMKEIWKPIVGFEPYEASNTGRIRGPNGIKKGHKCQGYLNVVLNGATMGIHRAVLLAFVPKPDGDIHADHINCIKDDNRLSNLQWVTRAENMRLGHYRRKYGFTVRMPPDPPKKPRKPGTGSKAKKKLTPDLVRQIRRLFESGSTYEAVRRELPFPITKTALAKVKLRRSWKYLED